MGRTSASTRIGGHAVAESLRALGAEVAFGLPGVHALPMWEGMREVELPVLGLRQEVNAGFAADGYARATGRPAAVLVSTGPGAFMTLAPLTEASRAFVPIVVVATQINARDIGQGRGKLHETPDQAASFAPLVKWTGRANSVDEIPHVLAEAWRRAQTPPQGPVYVEIPYDVLRTPVETATEDGLTGDPGPGALPAADELDRAAARLAGSERPLVVAGGGAVRSGAGTELLELAARLDSPVATTYTGKGAVPESHPLAVGSAWDDAVHQALVAESDVLLVVGSWLGYEFTDAFRELGGNLIQIDAAPERIGVNVPALGLVGDAKPVVQALLERIEPGVPRGGKERAAAVRAGVERGLREQEHREAVELLEIVDSVLPETAAAAWDSTILAYAACWYLRVDDPRSFLYPAGSSTLGYAWPAALGAAVATPGSRVLAVAGDGGFQYGMAELATAKQHGLDVALLLVDDGGYGILREYQDEAGFAHAGVDLEHPDFAAVCNAYGIPARRSSSDGLEGDLRWALEVPGPAVVVLADTLVLPQPAC